MPRRAIGQSTKPPTIKQLAMDVKKINKKIVKKPKPELKYHDSLITTGASIGYNVNVVNYALVEPPQGDTVITRDGSAITLKNLDMRYVITGDNTVNDDVQKVKLMLIQARNRFTPSNTATSGSTQVFDQAGTNDVVSSRLTWTNRVHYRVLKSKVVRLQRAAEGGLALQYTGRFHYDFKKFNNQVTFDGTGIVAQKNQVYLIAVGDRATDYPTIEFSCRVTFWDN